MKITEVDNGNVLQMRVDELLEIELTWNPSTGYMWRAERNTAAVLQGIRQEPKVDDGTVGSPTKVSFLFKVKRSGTIEMTLARPWNDADQANWFFVMIDVAKPD